MGFGVRATGLLQGPLFMGQVLGFRVLGSCGSSAVFLYGVAMVERVEGINIGALIIRIRIGFGVYYTIIIIRNPQNLILTNKPPT